MRISGLPVGGWWSPEMEKEMATHSSVLAWRIPGTVEPGGLPSLGSHRVRPNWSNLATAAAEAQRCYIRIRMGRECPRKRFGGEVRLELSVFGRIAVVQVSKSCPPLCDPMDYSIPGFPVLHYLLEFAQTHVHWVGDSIQPSHLLSPPSLLALNLSQHQGLWKGV